MKRRSLRGLCALSIVLTLTSDAVPSEFRIFAKGINPSRKGPVLFDDAAARAVMGAYSDHGADLMIDLEHLSLDDEAPNYDPDARGWCQLELRNGELWATNVRWTPDGEARLKQKRQRYISPAFRRDPESKRALEVVNVAICAMPATDNLTPLVAAKAKAAPTKGQHTTMFNPKLLAALGLAEDASDEDVKNAMAEAMKDPVKMAAMLSAAFSADDAGEGGEDGEGEALSEDVGDDAGAAKPGTKPTTKPTVDKRSRGQVLVSGELAAELVQLRQKVGRQEVTGLILANRKKFTPALERWALEAFADDSEGLSKWLKAQPDVAGGKSPVEKQPTGKSPGGAGGGKELKLSRADLELCRLTQRDPKDFLKHKRELAAQGDPEALSTLIDEEEG